MIKKDLKGCKQKRHKLYNKTDCNSQSSRYNCRKSGPFKAASLLFNGQKCCRARPVEKRKRNKTRTGNCCPSVVCKKLFQNRKLRYFGHMSSAMYAITTIGITISFAGKPSINAISITPSRPMSLAAGSRKSDAISKRLSPPTVILAASHMIAPAGAATAAARPSTNSVRSNTDLIITLPICGRRYGGSSSVNDDGTPRSTVFERNHVIIKVAAIPDRMTTVSRAAVRTPDAAFAPTVIKNIVIIDIIAGNLPLQGTRLLVSMARSLSRGESIMRHPITPAALHPSPIHMVRDCLPHALQR